MSPDTNDAKFCDTCGAQLFPDSKFCHQCGMKTQLRIVEESDSKKGDSKNFTLFQVYSVVNNFHFNGVLYDNLRINWFVRERLETAVSFKESIVNYLEIPFLSRTGPENYIKERFTYKEAKLLKLYLQSRNKIKAVISGCTLPINEDAKGYRDSIPPPGTGFIALYKKSKYTLPFKVEGIFNTRMADERVVGDDNQVTIVSGIDVKEIQKQLKEKIKDKK